MVWDINRKTAFTIMGLLAVLLTSCLPSFRFNSASAPTYATQIVIPLFPNESDGGPSDLSILFTEQVRDFYQNNTKLEVLTDESNASDSALIVKGVITNYDVSTIAPSSDGIVESSIENKISLNVKVSYINPFDCDPEIDSTCVPVSFKNGKSFSGFSTYDANLALEDVELDQINDIADQIIIKIFSATFDTF